MDRYRSALGLLLEKKLSHLDLGVMAGPAEFQLLLQEVKGEVLSSERYDFNFKTRIQELLSGSDLERIALSCSSLHASEARLLQSHKKSFIDWVLEILRLETKRSLVQKRHESHLRQKIFSLIYEEFRTLYEKGSSDAS